MASSNGAFVFYEDSAIYIDETAITRVLDRSRTRVHKKFCPRGILSGWEKAIEICVRRIRGIPPSDEML